MRRMSIGEELRISMKFSLEIELPFIHQLFGTKAKIVMIMVGNVSEKRKVEYAKY
jgi:hypothetical protein